MRPLIKVAAITPPDWELKIIDEKVESLDLNEHADNPCLTHSLFV